MKYPKTKTVDVMDDYHGRKVSDPYRWLEDTESEQTAEWIAAENKITQRYLQSIPALLEICTAPRSAYVTTLDDIHTVQLH